MGKRWDQVYQSTLSPVPTKMGHKSILFDGTYYFIADVVSGHFKVYRWDVNWANESTVYDYTLPHTFTSAGIPAIFKSGSVIYVSFTATMYDVSTAYYDYRVIETSDSGANWTVHSTTTPHMTTTLTDTDVFVLTGTNAGIYLVNWLGIKEVLQVLPIPQASSRDQVRAEWHAPTGQ